MSKQGSRDFWFYTTVCALLLFGFSWDAHEGSTTWAVARVQIVVDILLYILLATPYLYRRWRSSRSVENVN